MTGEEGKGSRLDAAQRLKKRDGTGPRDERGRTLNPAETAQMAPSTPQMAPWTT